MHALEHGARALRAEAGRALAALRGWRLWSTLALFAAALALAAQLPLSYGISIGLDEGFGGDMPLVADFHAPETSGLARDKFRWTTERSLIDLRGFGGRALRGALRLLPVSPEIAERGPREIELWGNGALIARMPVRPATGGVYRFTLPSLPGAGDQLIELRSATYTPAGDARAIGTPIDDLRVEAPAGPALPPWRHDLAWLAAALLLWLALRRAGLAPAHAQIFLLVCAALASAAAWLDPPRFAFGSGVALIIAALGWLLAILLTAEPSALLLAGAGLAVPAFGLRAAAAGELADQIGAALAGASVALLLAGWLRPALARGYARVAPPIPPAAQRWLRLLALLVFMTHYGGKIYPDAMWGDIGFHYNRYVDVLRGMVLLLSRNRGVDFPYPPALYLLLAPLGLTGVDPRVLLQLVGALLDAASPLVIYTIATAAVRRGRPAAQFGLLAATIYALSPATQMTTWWNFSTHIFTQFTHLLLIAALVLLWRSRAGNQEPRTMPSSAPVLSSWYLVFGILFTLQAMVYLGHFGFWMNMSLLGGLGLALLLAAALRRRVAWPLFGLLLGAYAAAELFAALFFYSGYTGLFLAQAQATANGGLTGLAGRPAIDRAILWRTLWDAGFRTHFGFFPVPLALGGLVLLFVSAKNQEPKTKNRVGTLPRLVLGSQFSVLAVLMAGTFVIALLFAALPFLSGSTLSTRWLMFSAWAIAVGAALVAQLLWRAGWAGRWLVLAMGAYIVWVSASMWLGALAWRVRPPEPF
jgi:hypothetical protein